MRHRRRSTHRPTDWTVGEQLTFIGSLVAVVLAIVAGTFVTVGAAW
ncbi:hypothetical protein [Humibacter ginsenosidimutans]|nr:hypothetical protein [Humibacter ginsenosidimutans]